MDSSLKSKLHTIIFGTHTQAGQRFDVGLIVIIALSVLITLIDSIPAYHQQWEHVFTLTEWIFTIIFTLEYGLRIYCSPAPKRYIFSFFGLIDLLAVLPSYLSIFMPGTEVLSMIRILRVLRVFKVLHLGQYMGEADGLIQALLASRRKIFVFLFFVLNIVLLLGSIMYLIEGKEAGFDSIPRGMYWAIVTLTTVGYGDLAPTTAFGQSIASMIMILGYSILAVPTGIVSTEIAAVSSKSEATTQSCSHCHYISADPTPKFCSQCGQPWTSSSTD